MPTAISMLPTTNLSGTSCSKAICWWLGLPSLFLRFGARIGRVVRVRAYLNTVSVLFPFRCVVHSAFIFAFHRVEWIGDKRARRAGRWEKNGKDENLADERCTGSCEWDSNQLGEFELPCCGFCMAIKCRSFPNPPRGEERPVGKRTKKERGNVVGFLD